MTKAYLDREEGGVFPEVIQMNHGENYCTSRFVPTVHTRAFPGPSKQPLVGRNPIFLGVATAWDARLLGNHSCMGLVKEFSILVVIISSLKPIYRGLASGAPSHHAFKYCNLDKQVELF